MVRWGAIWYGIVWSIRSPPPPPSPQGGHGQSDFRFRGGGVTGTSPHCPPPPPEGSCDKTPQNGRGGPPTPPFWVKTRLGGFLHGEFFHLNYGGFYARGFDGLTVSGFFPPILGFFLGLSGLFYHFFGGSPCFGFLFHHLWVFISPLWGSFSPPLWHFPPHPFTSSPCFSHGAMVGILYWLLGNPSCWLQFANCCCVVQHLCKLLFWNDNIYVLVGCNGGQLWSPRFLYDGGRYFWD